jgi:hypothetical protein
LVIASLEMPSNSKRDRKPNPRYEDESIFILDKKKTKKEVSTPTKKPAKSQETPEVKRLSSPRKVLKQNLKFLNTLIHF